MKHDSLNLTAPHTLRELGQAETKAGAALALAEIPREEKRLDLDAQPVTLTYRNWRGEVAERTIIPGKVWFGSTDWHPEPQWLLTAFDIEKGADRDFALKDFGQPDAPAVVLPDDIALALVSLGKAQWGGPDAQSDEDHTKDFANSLRLTREHFGTEGPQVLHGLYVEGTNIVLCHTGTSPNSAIHARALTGAWNWLHGIAAAQVDARAELDTRGKR